MKEAVTTKKRLASLDVLRGLDLWFLIIVGPLLRSFFKCSDVKCSFIQRNITHVDWEGFVAWDLIMPLFMFMSGITIPFALAKYKNELKPGKEFYLKLAKRFAGLFILGWIVQSNLLDLEWRVFKPLSNTLHAIAIGYVAAALLFVHCKLRGQITAIAICFIAYLAAFVFSGDCLIALDSQDNIAMNIDKFFLGSHRDSVSWAEDGSWSYNSWYPYTWILSSLNFIVTVMLGCFAGEMIRHNGDEATSRKALLLAGTGVALMAGGLVINPFFPIIKPIWSSAMTLYSGGLSFLLMAATYYAVDVRKWGGKWEWAKYFGMNSIAVYVLSHVVDFTSVSESLLYGLNHLTGNFYPFIIKLSNLCILILIMRYMYRKNIFLKV